MEISWTFNGSKDLGVVCKHLAHTFNNLREVIDEYNKETWPQDTPLRDTTGHWGTVGLGTIHLHTLSSTL